jgi:hypothetical protein
VPEALVLRSAADDTGRQSVGIRWFDYDRTDSTVNENADDSRVGRLQPEGLAAASGFAR